MDLITSGIIWERLSSIVDRSAATLHRTAFSQIIREGKDHGCVILDRQGDLVVMSQGSAPSVACLAMSAKAFLKNFSASKLRPGDVLMSNDPWICAGHLNDFHMLTPVFHNQLLVGFAACFAHWVDVGGRPLSSENHEVYEEGICIPICKIVEEGKPNDAILGVLASNVRLPRNAMGDFWAQIAANETTAAEVGELLDEYALANIDEVAGIIFGLSEQRVRKAIEDIRDGTYVGSVVLDGYDTPLRIKLRIEIDGTDMLLDYDGSSPQIPYALNSVYNFTCAYTLLPLKHILAPEIPNNAGCMRPVRILAPEGSILNPRRPAPVGQRIVVGHFLHAAILRALADVVPERIQAESGSCPNWSVNWNSIGKTGDDAFAQMLFSHGGQGAFPHRDGNSCTPYPSNVMNTPIEVVERVVPVLYETKELRPDSGGAGRFRGGLGQRVSARYLGDDPIRVTIRCDRIRSSESVARGVLGGLEGALGRVQVNGRDVGNPKAELVLQHNDLLTLETPGGGGYGSPNQRDQTFVFEDLLNGYVSPEKANELYGLNRAGE